MRFIKRIVKNTLENVCVWILGKLNIQRLKKLMIDDKRVVIGISKFIPDDGVYHKVGITTDFWIKITSKRRIETMYDDVKIYVDGSKKGRARLKIYKNKKNEN